MKLRTKITLAATASMLFLSQAFSLWNLSMTQRQIIDNILVYESEQLQNDVASFSRKLDPEHMQDQRIECYEGQSIFRSGFSRDAVLYYNEEEIDNRTPYLFDLKNAEKLSSQYQSDAIPDEYGISVFLEELGGRHLLFLYKTTGSFQLLHYRDVTTVLSQAESFYTRGS